MDIVFRVPAEEADHVLQALRADARLQPKTVHSAGALGGGDLATILVSISAAAIPLIVKLIVELDRNRRASVEVGGIKLSGISRAAAEEFLRERLIDK